MSLTELQANVAVSFFEIDKTTTVLQQAHSIVGEARTIMVGVTEGLTHPEALEGIEALTEAYQRIGELSVGLCAAKQNFTEYLESVGVMLPSLAESANDSSRTNVVYTNDRGATRKEWTEQEVLQELVVFLETYIEKGANEEVKADARSIKESLNFVGTEKLNQACALLAEDWATYLEGNEQAQIMIVPGVSQWQQRPKSDALIVDKILTAIEENHSGIADRIVGTIGELHADPENVRVIAVDDWIISGRQMSATLKHFAGTNKDSPYIDRLEVNLVIALPETLAEGLMPSEFTSEQSWIKEHESYVFPTALPVKSAFIARPRISPDVMQDTPTPMHVTGSHTTADFGFSETIDSILDEFVVDNASIRMPAAAFLRHRSEHGVYINYLQHKEQR